MDTPNTTRERICNRKEKHHENRAQLAKHRNSILTKMMRFVAKRMNLTLLPTTPSILQLFPDYGKDSKRR